MTTPSAVSYLRVTDPSYAQLAANSFTLEDFGTAQTLSGPCPRCGHPMEFTVVRRLLRDVDTPVPAATSAPVPADRSVVVYCTADSVVYENAPVGESGCGAYWSVTLPTGAGG
ncbi:hypothetical protein [Streptomyces sp. NPDC002845]